MKIWKLLIISPHPDRSVTHNDHVFLGRDFREAGEANMAEGMLKLIWPNAFVKLEAVEVSADYFDDIDAEMAR